MTLETPISQAEPIQSLPDAFLFPIERIKPNPNQPRQDWDETQIIRIAKGIQSLRAKGRGAGGTGILQPLLVRWESGAFDENGVLKFAGCVIIIAGETRWRAAREAGLDVVPVVVTDQDSESAYEDALIENILRGDLSPANEGQAFQFLMNLHKVSALGLALRLYHDPSREGYIQNRLDMTRLNEIVRPLISDNPKSMSAARRIQSVNNEDKQRELVQMAMAGATFKEINAEVQKFKGIVVTGQTSAQKKEESDATRKLQEAFPTNSPTHAPSSSPSQNEGTNGGNDSGQVYGTPRAKGITTAPSIHVGDSLDSLGAQMEHLARALAPANLPRATRKKYAPKVERLAKAFAQIQFDLDPQ